LDFANGKVRATCAIEIADTSRSLSMKLKSLLIHDAKLGDISFPNSETPLTNPKP